MNKIKLLLLCLVPLLANAQSAKIDSLLNVLTTQKQSATKEFDLYTKICHYYFFTAFDSNKTIEYAQKGLELSKKGKNDYYSSVFHEYIGYVYIERTYYDTAYIHFDKALELAIKSGDEELIKGIYIDLGALYGNKENWDLALEYFLKALPLFENSANKRRYSNVLGNIGAIYRMLNNTDKAISYFKQVEEIAEELNEMDLKQMPYYELGVLYRDKKEYGKSFEYIQKALEISRISGDKQYQTICLQVLAQLYSTEDFKEYDKAIECINESLTLSEEITNTFFMFDSWLTLSTVYLRQEKYKESVEAAYKALEIDTTSLRNMIGIYTNLTESYMGIGKTDSALISFHKYCDLKDKYITKELQESVAKMETVYETKKKEIRITTLEEEQKLYAGLGISIVIAFLSIIGLLIYRHHSTVQKRKIAEQQIKQLEQEKELIAARSALGAEKAEREMFARDLHDGVGAMLSVVKNNMNIMKSYSFIENKEADYFNKALDGLDKSIVELRRVAHHIMPAILVDNGLVAALNDFCRAIPEVEFHFTEPENRFDAEKELVLYRCAYELVNNALRHAKATHIDVHLNVDEKTVYLSVVDDGCGFDLQTVSPGMGINNMRTRLLVFGGRIDFYSEPGKSTEVNIELDL